MYAKSLKSTTADPGESDLVEKTNLNIIPSVGRRIFMANCGNCFPAGGGAFSRPGHQHPFLQSCQLSSVRLPSRPSIRGFPQIIHFIQQKQELTDVGTNLAASATAPSSGFLLCPYSDFPVRPRVK